MAFRDFTNEETLEGEASCGQTIASRFMECQPDRCRFRGVYTNSAIFPQNNVPILTS